MPKLPVISAKELIRLLLKNGCVMVSIKGSHFKIHNPVTGMTTVIPVHGNKDLDKGFLASIISQLGINADDFLKYR